MRANALWYLFFAEYILPTSLVKATRNHSTGYFARARLRIDTLRILKVLKSLVSPATYSVTQRFRTQLRYG